MSYVALYRKYRPQTFDDVIGQDHIITTLRNQILKDKISHAYLFTGTRGTGKTSTAKILARAVNCPHAKEHNGNACGVCDTCKALADVNMDIIEMDAASNNGVEYARDIREKVQFPPVNGRYKVYIIDEVHMLSVGAFNALLKTLEEPPAHAMFILCTTEVHKLPATILSRCMRFDFKLVPTQMLANHIGNIYDKEGKAYTKDALLAIATAGEGSVRDTVSIADRCYSVTEGKLTYESVMGVLGVSSRSGVVALGKAVLSNDAGEILTEIHRLVSEGKDVARLAKDLSVYFRDLLVVKTCQNAREMLALPEEQLHDMQHFAAEATDKKLLYAIDTLVGMDSALRYALSPQMLLEATALRIASSTGLVDVDGLDRRITRLEQLPQNITAEQKNVYVVDKSSAKSIWKGVKMALEDKNLPLLLGLWKEVEVDFDAMGNYLVRCEKGAYMLIDIQYRAFLTAEIGRFTNKPVKFAMVENLTDSQVNKQLENLGSNVTIK